LTPLIALMVQCAGYDVRLAARGRTPMLPKLHLSLSAGQPAYSALEIPSLSRMNTRIALMVWNAKRASSLPAESPG
jgi:hypothetical protein